MKPKHIGFAGLGNMGRPMAANMVSGRFELFVFDMAGTEERAPEGTRQVTSITELGSKCETIFLSLPDGQVSRDIAQQLAEQQDSTVSCVIDLSTVGVEASRQISSILKASDITYIDAPVSGGKSGAVSGTLTIIWAGPAHIMEDHRPTLEKIAKNLFHIGDEAGQAQSMKLLNNYLSATALMATSEAIIFGLKQGLDMKSMLDVLNASSGQNTATRDKFPKQVLTEKYAAGFHMALMTKDLTLFHQHVQSSGSPAKLVNPLVKLWQEANEAMPGSDFTQIYEFIRDES